MADLLRNLIILERADRRENVCRQEYGIRPGTLPTHQIAGFAKAIEIAKNALDRENNTPC